MKPSQRRNLSQAVADDLLALVREQDLKAGDKLPPERALMEHFTVGRNTLREAVQSLVAIGILDVRPGTGTRVRSLAAEQILNRTAVSALLQDESVAHLYELRLVLESEAAARAATDATDEQIASLLDALRAYKGAADRGGPLFPRDITIHQLIAASCTNPLYGTILEATRELLSRTRQQTDMVPGATQRALREHTAIVEAISRRDPEAAREAMGAHLASALWALTEARQMSSQEPPDGEAKPQIPAAEAANC